MLLASVLLIMLAVQTIAADWFPHGDEAVIAIKAHDSWTGHPSLLGMRSTSDETVRGVWVHHPGPLQFWLIGLPYALTGFHPSGLVIGCLILSLVFAGVALWSAYRAAGRVGCLVMGFTVLALILQFGDSLVLPWNPWASVLSLLAMLSLGWRILLGHRGHWPLYVFCSSFAAQAHLAVLPIVVVLSSSLLAYVAIRRRRQRRRVFRRRELRRSLVVALVCWAGPLVDLLTYEPNNLTEFWRLTTGSQAQAQGDALAHLTSMLFPWERRFNANAELAVLGVAVLALTVAVLFVAWRRARHHQRFPDGRNLVTPGLVWTTLGLFVLAIAGLRTRGSPVANMDYASAVTMLHTALLAAWLGLAARAWLRRRSRWMGMRASLAGAIGVLLLGLVAMPPAAAVENHRRGYGPDAVLAREVLDQVTPTLSEERFARLPIVVRGYGIASWLGVAPAIQAALVAEGRDVRFDNAWPNKEDDDFRRIRYVFGNRVNVVVSERNPGGEWSFEPAIDPVDQIVIRKPQGGELRVQFFIQDEDVPSARS